MLLLVMIDPSYSNRLPTILGSNDIDGLVAEFIKWFDHDADFEDSLRCRYKNCGPGPTPIPWSGYTCYITEV